MPNKPWPFTEVDDGNFSFFRELNENKVFRNKSDLQRITHEQARDLFYLNFLALYALSLESKTAEWAQATALRSASMNGFDDFKVSFPDMYNLSYMHFGDTGFDDIGVETQWKKNALKPLKMLYLRALRGIATGKISPSEFSALTLKMEKAMNIDNGVFKQLRRTIATWNQQPEKEHRSAWKRLYRYTRATNPRSEFLPIIKDKLGLNQPKLFKEIDLRVKYQHLKNYHFQEQKSK